MTDAKAVLINYKTQLESSIVEYATSGRVIPTDLIERLSLTKEALGEITTSVSGGSSINTSAMEQSLLDIKNSLVTLISITANQQGNTSVAKEFSFTNQLGVVAVHNYGRRAVVAVTNLQGHRISCEEVHTTNSVTINFNIIQSGVITCV